MSLLEHHFNCQNPMLWRMCQSNTGLSICYIELLWVKLALALESHALWNFLHELDMYSISIACMILIKLRLEIAKRNGCCIPSEFVHTFQRPFLYVGERSENRPFWIFDSFPRPTSQGPELSNWEGSIFRPFSFSFSTGNTLCSAPKLTMVISYVHKDRCLFCDHTWTLPNHGGPLLPFW